MPETVYDAFVAVAQATPDAPCLAVPSRPGRPYLPDGMEESYAAVRRKVDILRDAYARQGYGLGHRVALSLENRPLIIYHWLALNALGAAIVPINPDFVKDDLSFLLTHSEADLVVALPERCDALRAITREHAGVPIFAADAELAALPIAPRPANAGGPGQETESAILYTSGTTGKPKGCRICNDYLFFAGERYLAAGGLMRITRGQERLYNPLPLFYANSLAISNMAMILSGGCMIFPDRFHPRSFWADIVSTGATIIHYLGLIPPVLLSLPSEPQERAHRVRFGVGAGVDPTQHKAFEKRFGFPLIEVWGMSEVAICSAENHEPRRMGARSIGKPLPGVELAILDDDDNALPCGVPGELAVRRKGGNPRSGFFAGYYKDDAETEQCWRNGWFHTGDIATRSEDGGFIFVDRKKHMIRRSGQNIAAAEVEQVLLSHPDVMQVGIIPAPDPLREEEVLACVVLREEAAADVSTAESLVNFCLQRIAYFKAPGWVAFFSSLPMTSTQKLQKSKILAPGSGPESLKDCFDLRGLKTKEGRTKSTVSDIPAAKR
ncbi:crotonobetaine/carnitine-CoA ligase [Rhodoligotrophos appendicifer]|uniref:AMP-binding protein n=1 Tax=Rhodoligotrophos appendicifer TaxID=987056 RepID=UPI00147894F7|nr:AMP-binding protein [Rhodoligotrophos appendicifer]